MGRARLLGHSKLYAHDTVAYPARMVKRWSIGVSLALCSALACSSSDDGSDAKTPDGALSCDGLAIDCRAAYADEYDGTYTGSDQGRFTLRVDILGGVSGTVLGDGAPSAAATGQVNEFGQIAFTLPDGTKFDGQFAADGTSFQGSWTGPAGSGTFSGKSATRVPVNGGTGGAASGTGGNGNSVPPPSVAEVQAAVKDACQAVANCGLVAESTCATVMPRSLTDCLREELTLYQCTLADPCNSLTTCEPQSNAMQACFTAMGTLPPVSGIAALDRATQACDACRTHGAACGNSFDCFSYALCIDGCAPGNAACEDPCKTSNPTGSALYDASISCQTEKCP